MGDVAAAAGHRVVCTGREHDRRGAVAGALGGAVIGAAGAWLTLGSNWALLGAGVWGAAGAALWIAIVVIVLDT